MVLRPLWQPALEQTAITQRDGPQEGDEPIDEWQPEGGAIGFAPGFNTADLGELAAAGTAPSNARWVIGKWASPCCQSPQGCKSGQPSTSRRMRAEACRPAVLWAVPLPQPLALGQAVVGLLLHRGLQAGHLLQQGPRQQAAFELDRLEAEGGGGAGHGSKGGAKTGCGAWAGGWMGRPETWSGLTDWTEIRLSQEVWRHGHADPARRA